MDSFNKLPPEIRENISFSTESFDDVTNLTQASPAMHLQYQASRAHIARKILEFQLPGRLLQDAFAIMTFPDEYPAKLQLAQASEPAEPFDAHDARSRLDAIDRHLKRWVKGNFPETLHGQKASFICRQMYYCRVVDHVEDYLSKTKSCNPVRASLCLPAWTSTSHFSDSSSQAEFTTPKAKSLPSLNVHERWRLLQGFFLYNLSCLALRPHPHLADQLREATPPPNYGLPRKYDSVDHDVDDPNLDEPFIILKYLRAFSSCSISWEKERVCSVVAYVQSLYRGLFFQPTLPENSHLFPKYSLEDHRRLHSTFVAEYGVIFSLNGLSFADGILHGPNADFLSLACHHNCLETMDGPPLRVMCVVERLIDFELSGASQWERLLGVSSSSIYGTSDWSIDQFIDLFNSFVTRGAGTDFGLFIRQHGLAFLDHSTCLEREPGSWSSTEGENPSSKDAELPSPISSGCWAWSSCLGTKGPWDQWKKPCPPKGEKVTPDYREFPSFVPHLKPMVDGH